jgi:hypothetical protein
MILFCISYNSINQQPTRFSLRWEVNISYANVLLDHLNNHADTKQIKTNSSLKAKIK